MAGQQVPEVHFRPAGARTIAEGLTDRARAIEARLAALGDDSREAHAMLAVIRRVRRSLENYRIQYVLPLSDPEMPEHTPLGPMDWDAPPPPQLADPKPEPDRLGAALTRLRQRP